MEPESIPVILTAMWLTSMITMLYSVYLGVCVAAMAGALTLAILITV